MKKFVLAILITMIGIVAQEAKAQIRIKASSPELLESRLNGETVKVGNLDYVLFDSTNLSLGAQTAQTSSLSTSKARVFTKKLARIGAIELGVLLVLNNTGKIKVYHSKGLNLAIAHKDALSQGNSTDTYKNRFKSAIQSLAADQQIISFLTTGGSSVEVKLQAAIARLSASYQSTVDNIIQ